MERKKREQGLTEDMTTDVSYYDRLEPMSYSSRTSAHHHVIRRMSDSEGAILNIYEAGTPLDPNDTPKDVKPDARVVMMTQFFDDEQPHLLFHAVGTAAFESAHYITVDFDVLIDMLTTSCAVHTEMGEHLGHNDEAVADYLETAAKRLRRRAELTKFDTVKQHNKGE